MGDFAFENVELTQPVFRHVKRGTTYRVLSRATLQTADCYHVDGAAVLIYVGEDGAMWVRPEAEFLDGRFERLPTPASKGGTE